MDNIYGQGRKDEGRRPERFYYSGSLNDLASVALEDTHDTALALATEGMIAPGIIQTFTDGTIGSGLSLKATPDRRVLTVSDKKIDKASKAIEAELDLIRGDPNLCDYYGQWNFDELCRQAFTSALINGDVLIGYRIKERNGRMYPALQVIDGRQVANKDSSPLDTPTMIAGVEINKNGNETGYWVKEYNDSLTTPTYKRVDRYSPNGILINTLVKLNMASPAQRRGRSMLSSVSGRIINIKRYDAAELLKAIVQANIPFFVEKEKKEGNGSDGGETRTHVMDDMAMANGATEDEGKTACNPVRIKGGFVNVLSDGESIKFPQATSPVSQFWQYMEALLKLIAMDLGIPYTVLLHAFNSNYSASQAEIRDAAQKFDILRKSFISQAIGPYYDLHVWLLKKQGIVTLPGFDQSPILRRAWCTATWYGPSMLNIDPVKNANASESLINLGLSTRTIEARKYGNDYEDNITALKEEQALAKKNGVTLGSSVVVPQAVPDDNGGAQGTNGGGKDE